MIPKISQIENNVLCKTDGQTDIAVVLGDEKHERSCHFTADADGRPTTVNIVIE
jgi:hypothetical protein